jgi:two-component system, OmpR family, phosphate regulon sensor histidine kinase PhoR
MKIRSLKLKLILSYVFVIIFTFGLVAFFLDKNLEENSLSDLKSSLVNQAQLIESQLSSKPIIQTEIPILETLVKDLSSRIKSRITIVDTQGQVLADSQKLLKDIPDMENHAARPEIKSALAGIVAEEIRYSSTLKINMLYVAVPIKARDGIVGVIRLALPLVSVEDMLNGIRNAIIFSIIFALLLAFVSGSLITSGIIKPVNKIIRVSRKFSTGDFTHKIYHDSKDEIGELADTLNKMASDIEAKMKDVNSQSQQLRAIFNSMIEGVMLTDREGHIVSVNQAIERIFQVVKPDVEGKTFLEAIRNNDIAEIITAVLRAGKSVSKEIALIFPVQSIFEVNATPIFESGSVNGCLVVIHDITEIRRLETMRRDFVANVSHELKTPLTSIKGFVETLLEGALEDKENNRNFLKIIQEHADRLDKLVNDLLSLSHLESQGIVLDKREFNLNDQVKEVIAGFKSQLKNKGIEVTNQLPNELIINGDQDRVEQVLVNLIDNAIKFNKDKGPIKIYKQDHSGNIKIIIEDFGMGIPGKDIPRIFERFYRVDKARSRQLGGTGLGLSIVKHIIELHGGTVGVESTEGLGSKFWFSLPIR